MGSNNEYEQQRFWVEPKPSLVVKLAKHIELYEIIRYQIEVELIKQRDKVYGK